MSATFVWLKSSETVGWQFLPTLRSVGVCVRRMSVCEEDVGGGGKEGVRGHVCDCFARVEP